MDQSNNSNHRVFCLFRGIINRERKHTTNKYVYVQLHIALTIGYLLLTLY